MPHQVHSNLLGRCDFPCLSSFMQRAKLSGSRGQSCPSSSSWSLLSCRHSLQLRLTGMGLSGCACTSQASSQPTEVVITHPRSQMGNEEGCYTVRPETHGEWQARRVSCARGPDVKACVSKAVDCSSPASSLHGVPASKGALGSSRLLKELQKAAPSL